MKFEKMIRNLGIQAAVKDSLKLYRFPIKFCIQNAPASTPRSIVSSSSLSLKPYSSSQLHSFINMNRTRERGWFANQHNLSSTSDSGTPPHAIQCNKNKSQQPHQRPTEAGVLENATSRNPRAGFQQMVKSSHSERPVFEPALGRTHQQRGVAWRPVNRTTSRNSVEAPLDGGSSKQHHPLPECHDEVAHVSDTEQHIPSATTSESVMGQTSSAPKDGSPQSSESGQDGVGRHKSPERFRKVMSQSQSRSKGHSSAEPSKKEISQQGKSPPKTEPSRHSPDLADDMPYTPIDLFLRKPKTIMLKASFLEQNREKRKDLERSFNDSRPHMLRPGMVLLKNFITPKDQIKILKKCRDTGLGSGGFYKPGYSDGAKLRLHMMCLGKDWDPQTRSYKEFRSIDGVKPPVIPDEFRKLVGDAIQASHVMIQENGVRYPEKSIPRMEPDICIVNFYTDTGKLGLHQDRDESAESIKNGLPVVSFSIGDSAEFLYGDDRDVDKAKKIELKSGDVLIFGGKSRLVFHGVPSIIPNTAPKFLVDEVNLRPGRLNLTFRKY